MTDRQIAATMILLAPIAIPICACLFGMILAVKIVDYAVTAFTTPEGKDHVIF